MFTTLMINYEENNVFRCKMQYIYLTFIENGKAVLL